MLFVFCSHGVWSADNMHRLYIASHIQILECLLSHIALSLIWHHLPLSHMPHNNRYLRQWWFDHFILQENHDKEKYPFLKLRRSQAGQGPPRSLAYIYMYKYTDQYFQLLTTRYIYVLWYPIATLIVTYLSHYALMLH